MTTHILWLLLWLVCALIAYLLVRRGHRGMIGKWTQMDRVYWVGICLLYGPITLLLVAIIGLAMMVSDTNWAKREAQW